MATTHVRCRPTAGAARSVVAAMLLVAFLLALSGNAVAVPVLQTDATWRVTPTDPGGNWNTDPGFDDSGWQNATVLYDAGTATGDPAFTGAKGIWSAGGQFSTTETQVWIRKVFDLPGPLSSASLTVGCDDDCAVWVNGTQVINDTNGFANNNVVADLLPFLNLGSNLIAYTATDNFRVFGFNHSTWAQLDAVLTVPEPGSSALLALGITGVWLARRRSRS